MLSSQSTTTKILDKHCSNFVLGVKITDKEFNSENLSSEVIEVKGKTLDNDSTKQKDSVLVSYV